MASFTPPHVCLPDTAPDDPRIGHLLGRKLTSQANPQVVIIGFPADEGVRRNGGRTGAALGPDAIRQSFYQMTPLPEQNNSFYERLEYTRDLGNLETSGNVEDDQEILAEALAPFLSQHVLSIVLGGGHETAYGHFLGYVKAQKKISILNWDAHTDVRELKDGLAHSGSPFRQAILHPSQACRSYHVAGLLPTSVAQSHLAFVTEHGGRYEWKESLSPERIKAMYTSYSTPVMASFDLDAVDQAFAPGVSAPAVNGLSPDLWLHAAYVAGTCPLVRSMDIVELNPLFDRDQQTARLAALTLWSFFKGLGERDSAHSSI